MRFVKMHGIGNDYIYVDATPSFGDPGLADRPDLPELARAISDRHTGVGSDGLILVCAPTPPTEAGADPPHVRMRMFNADGSESEMCGNGVRCVAKFAHDRMGIRANPMRVETGRGVLAIGYTTAGGKLEHATVDMGAPIFDLERIPVDSSHLEGRGRPSSSHVWLVRLSGGSALRAEGGAGAKGSSSRHEVPSYHAVWAATFVSMGNPHAVVFERDGEALTLDELRELELDRIGPAFERHAAFPRRTNVHFVSVQGRGAATMRTWERGSGVTQACGTGACAVLAAGVLTGRLDREAVIHLPGGDLQIAWDEPTNHIMMTGPAVDVFTGEWGS